MWYHFLCIHEQSGSARLKHFYMSTHEMQELEKSKMLILTGEGDSRPLYSEKNEVNLEGQVVSEVFKRHFANGNKMATFTIAHGIHYTSQRGEQVYIAEFFEVVSWNRVADMVSETIHRGAIIRFRGKLRRTSWLNQSGKPFSKVQIVMTEVINKAA